MENLIKK